jgi:hypothetical protein
MPGLIGSGSDRDECAARAARTLSPGLRCTRHPAQAKSTEFPDVTLPMPPRVQRDSRAPGTAGPARDTRDALVPPCPVHRSASR